MIYFFFFFYVHIFCLIFFFFNSTNQSAFLVLFFCRHSLQCLQKYDQLDQAFKGAGPPVEELDQQPPNAQNASVDGAVIVDGGGEGGQTEVEVEELGGEELGGGEGGVGGDVASGEEGAVAVEVSPP